MSFTSIINLFKKGLGFSLFVDRQFWFEYEEYGFLGYARREPESVNSGLKALNFTFSYQFDNKFITQDLILEIHKLSTEEVVTNSRDINYIENLRKKMSESEFKEKRLDEHCIIKQGFRQSGVYFRIGCYQPYKKEDCLLDLKSFKENNVKLAMSETGDLQNEVFGNPQSFDEYIHALESYHHSIEFPKEELALMSNDAYLFAVPELNPEKIQKRLEEICQNYNEKILRCESDEEKLRLILKTVKDIELTHPFHDGNLRVSLILMQRLLVQNNLKPTAFIDPNKLDNLPVDVLIKDYYDGVSALERLEKRQDQPFTKEKIVENYHEQFAWDDPKEIHLAKQIEDYYQLSENITEKLKKTDANLNSKNEKSKMRKQFKQDTPTPLFSNANFDTANLAANAAEF